MLIKKNYKIQLKKKNQKLKKKVTFFNKDKKKNSNKNLKKIFKLKKKWRFWRLFKRYFISKKKITFYKKYNWRFNNIRIIWHQFTKLYTPKIKNIILKRKKKNSDFFFFFLNKLELRLNVILLRARFFYKLINSSIAIKLNLILINGLIINKINCVVNILDLFQKKRQKNILFKNTVKRKERLKWRKFRWKKARYIFWKIRRASHFNMYWVKKQNTTINYLEINYKIPAGILIKKPFIKELYLNRQKKILTNNILKKIYFMY